jgi:hypothetical protein
MLNVLQREKGMLKKATFAVMAILLVVPLIMIGCGSGGGSADPIELVPQRANLVGMIDLSPLLSDNDFADIYDRLPKESQDPQTLSDALDRVKEQIGIDLRQFGEGVFFGDVSESADNGGYFGFIVKGDFNRDDLISAIETRAGIKVSISEYKGYEIYTDGDESSALSFLSNQMLVIGGMVPVKDVIQVKEGDRPALSGEVLETYNELGNALIKVASLIPESSRGALPSPSDGSSIDLSPFADVEKGGLVVAKEGQTISLKVKLYFTNSKSAESAGRLVSLAQTFTDVFPVPEQGSTLVPELLNKLELNTSGTLLTISIEMTVSEIEDMIESGNSS